MVHTSIHQRFAEQVADTPDRSAIVSGNSVLTYRELDERANRLAHRLLSLDVGPGEPVAVLMERSADAIATALAVLKAGAAYLPLDPAHPIARNRRIVDDARCAVMVTDAATRDRGLPSVPVTVIEMAEAATDAAPAGDPGFHPDVDTLACVIHTSGSTGRPKGVEITHAGVVAFASDRVWGDAHRRILSLAPQAFGVSLYELWVPLLNGGSVVLAPPGEPDVRTVRRLITDERITALHVTAGLFRVLAREAPDMFAPVREILTGGDVVTPTAVRAVLDACPAVTIRATYGATELVAFAAQCEMTARRPPSGPVPVGLPMDGVTTRLLDENLNPVADGEVGELFVGGTRLARGYLGRPDLTAERFVVDPHGAATDRLYRTGDLMRCGADGRLEFVGRTTDRVKIRGYLVEPAEVEHAITAHAAVAGAAVVVDDGAGAPDDRRLHAFVVLGDPSRPAPLRVDLERLLPSYMVPSSIRVVDRLPLTTNGKIDRAALRASAGVPVTTPTGNGAPTSGRLADLCRLFADVLAVPSVGADDDFFDLGGQSLQAIRLVARLERELGSVAEVADIFGHSTPAELEHFLSTCEKPGH
ncbi:non-ribosomal peptide synthetase [Streptomyces sp. ST2-7A]|uniref:non-ribosomal peptide synthetase n=1 Tax=Streptomyces sp. ST2-7A TaxID=2907214 RepID=UPI001F27A067|nr:non-ribosomal peptide synthetase [Streptomyces sp. ST2-7A]MCE7079513.1 non-ribosomal peptide synthetase [Streptomyces sp. ST2-7A]